MNTINRIIDFYQSIGLIEFAENIENIEIVENPENLENNLINEPAVLNLGPPPVLQREPYAVYDEAEELIADAEFQEFQTYDTPNDFVMPTPCSRCYRMSCYEDCSEEDVTPPVALKLSFEEEMGLPPPPALSRNSAVLLFDEEWRLPPQPLTRGYTDSHLPYDELKEDKEQEDEDK